MDNAVEVEIMLERVEDDKLQLVVNWQLRPDAPPVQFRGDGRYNTPEEIINSEEMKELVAAFSQVDHSLDSEDMLATMKASLPVVQNPDYEKPLDTESKSG